MKTRSYRYWTKEEDAELIELVKAHNGRLNMAFAAFQCANKDRSYSSIHARWYKELKPANAKKVCMSNVSRKRSTSKKTSSTKSRHAFLMKVWNSLTNLF